LLQPLDTHVFGAFKRRLHALQLQERAASVDGAVPPTRWIDLLETAVLQHITAGAWAHAIAENGLLGDTGRLRRRIGEALAGQLPLPLRAPGDAELATIVGRLRPGLAEGLCRPAARFLRRRLALAPAPGVAHPGDAAAAAGGGAAGLLLVG
jgi:hypothetical protein